MVKIYRWRWIILSFVFCWVVSLNIPYQFLELGGDSAQYIILAQSICKGTGLRAINHPDAPFFYHYPFIFPLLLCAIIYFLGRNIYLMHLLVAALGYLSLFFFYRLFKKYTDQKISFITVAFLATNGIFISYSAKHILSDAPFLFFTSFTLFFASKYLKKENLLNKEGFFTVFGLLLSYFTRYAGITLFLGLLVVLLASPKQKFRKVSLVFFAFLFPFLAWQIGAKILNPSAFSSFSQQFLLIDPYQPFLGSLFTHPKYLLIRLIEGGDCYYKAIGRSFFPYFMARWNFLTKPLCLISVILSFLGLWFKFRENKTCVFHYYFLIYFFLIVFWPYRESSRFILPILPFMYFYFFTSLKKLLNFLPRKIYLFALCSLLPTLFIFNALSLPTKASTYQDLPSPLKNFISLHYWIKENLPKEGVIISRKPTITYFYTNHQSIIYPYTLNPSQIAHEIIKNKVKYIVVDEFSLETRRYLLPFLYEYKDEVKFLYHIGRTGLFEVRQSS